MVNNATYNGSISFRSTIDIRRPGATPARADTTKMNKNTSIFATQKPTTAKPMPRPTNTQTTQSPANTQTTSKPASKPAPKAPTPQEANITSTNMQDANGNTLGTFDTNIPTFKDLNIKNPTIATAVTNGVGIYGGNPEDLSITEDTNATPPTTTVSFKNKGIKLTYNTPAPEADTSKQSIVFNPETGAYVFNNLEGIRLEAAHTGTNQVGKGGESFMINGGTVDLINTCERQTDDENSNNYNLLNKGVKTQNIVLKDTTVKDGAITLGNDNLLAIGNTQLNTDKINALDKDTSGSAPAIRSHVAFEGHNNDASRRAVQTGFSVSGAYTQWLGGTEADMKTLKTNDAKGSITVESDLFSSVNMKDATVARTVGNLQIFTQNGDGSHISVMANDDGTNTIEFKGRSLDFVIPNDQPENARIFVNEDTGTLYFENLEGVSYNGISGNHNNGYDTTQVNLFIKNCHFNLINTMEVVSGGSGKEFARFNTGNATRSNIAISDSTVDVLATSYDNIYMDDNAEVTNYVGFRNNAPDQLNAKNNSSLKYHVAQIEASNGGLNTNYSTPFQVIKKMIPGSR